MSEYKGIKGFQVQTRTTDPVPFAQELADNPYAGAWGSGGNLNQARRAIGGNGLQTAALAVGGTSTPGILANTESYNGTAWTAVNNLNQARRSPTITGTTSAALAFGGYNPPAGDVTANTESWDGTNWTAVTSMNNGVFGATWRWSKVRYSCSC